MRYDTGFELGLIAFTAAVLGGIGNLAGAVLGALLIGFIQAFNEGLDLARAGERLDALDRLRDPDPDPRLPARGHPRRTDARGRMSRSRRRARRSWRSIRAESSWIVVGLLVLALIYPSIVESLQSLPLDRRLHPEHGLAGDHDRVHDDGGRAQHRRRLRGPARPRVRRLLRRRRLCRGLARLRAVLPGRPAPRRRRAVEGHARDPHLDVARADHRRLLHDARRDRDRPAHAAPAWRLPRDRDTRLRRDRPAVRPQRRQRLRLRPHARHLRDQPDRLARVRLRSELRSGCRRASGSRPTARSGTSGRPS